MRWFLHEASATAVNTIRPMPSSTLGRAPSSRIGARFIRESAARRCCRRTAVYTSIRHARHVRHVHEGRPCHGEKRDRRSQGCRFGRRGWLAEASRNKNSALRQSATMPRRTANANRARPDIRIERRRLANPPPEAATGEGMVPSN